YDVLIGCTDFLDHRIQIVPAGCYIQLNFAVHLVKLLEENSDIRILRRKIARGHPVKTRDKRVTLGEKVKNALDRKREKEEAQILKVLKHLFVDSESGTIFGENMVTNTSFLVPEEKVDEFDAVVNRMSSERNGRMKFKYVGPVPPCNFVELTIVLE
ncbi:GvpL/GvpF family gas vesicle protein, partial [Acidobacteria bacterium AH-259-A15]|nr:GvpL/GvpF family gas vesicle protein [Acidobacteria bacterium AH-259-A15]